MHIEELLLICITLVYRQTLNNVNHTVFYSTQITNQNSEKNNKYLRTVKLGTYLGDYYQKVFCCLYIVLFPMTFE